jgi:hypothetical protein
MKLGMDQATFNAAVTAGEITPPGIYDDVSCTVGADGSVDLDEVGGKPSEAAVKLAEATAALVKKRRKTNANSL